MSSESRCLISLTKSWNGPSPKRSTISSRTWTWPAASMPSAPMPETTTRTETQLEVTAEGSMFHLVKSTSHLLSKSSGWKKSLSCNTPPSWSTSSRNLVPKTSNECRMLFPESWLIADPTSCTNWSHLVSETNGYLRGSNLSKNQTKMLFYHSISILQKFKFHFLYLQLSFSYAHHAPQLSFLSRYFGWISMKSRNMYTNVKFEMKAENL